MKRKSLRTVLILATAGILSSCANGGPLGINLPAASSNPSVFSEVVKGFAMVARQRVKVVFYNRLSNNELVPLVPGSLESLRFNGQFSLDAANFPRNKGLEQTFPFIEAGEHIIELSFQNQPTPVQVPIVVPRTQAVETVILVILSFDAAGNQVRDVQVGYDMNGDLALDTDMNIYRSSNGRSYLLQTPDGQVQEWNSPLQQGPSDNAAPSDAPLPPGSDNGSAPDAGPAPQPQDRNEKQSPPPPVDVPIPDQRPLPLPEIGRG